MPAPTINPREESSNSLQAIGVLHSPFTEKFGIPRQANLITSAYAEIELYPPYNDPDAFHGLEAFSHIWLSFSFHLNADKPWRPMIRPPRLGGNKKIGVFASRSPFRPNSLGQSLVELREVRIQNNQASLIIACPDILDGTPILDIKPYIDYADATSDSRCGFAQEPPKPRLKVVLNKPFKDKAQQLSSSYPDDLLALIVEVISYDPRPAYKQDQDDEKLYKLRLYDLDISFSVEDGFATISDIEKQLS